MQNIEGYLKIVGYGIIMNSAENKMNGNTIQGSKTLIKAKSYTQGSITDDYYFYYFTYNNISDFSSGYSNNNQIQYYSDKNYHYTSDVTITNNSDSSPFSFVDNVEIKEINFIPGTQYYQLYNPDKNTTYWGLLDIKQNKILYNIETNNIISFFPDYNIHILAISSTTLYRICVYKDCDSCSDTPCSNLMLDPDGNKCQDHCENEKIKAIPEGICINKDLCDLTIYIYI